MSFSSRLVRVIRRALIGLAIAATLVAALIVEENWRGACAWRHFVTDFQARGGKLDPAAYRHPPVPADLNFACDPTLAPFLSELTPKAEATRLEAAYGYRSWSGATGPDAVPQAQPIVIAVRRAAQERPLADFAAGHPLSLNLGHLLTLSQLLLARAQGELEADRNEDAFADAWAALRLGEGCADCRPGTLLEVMVGTAVWMKEFPILQLAKHKAAWSSARWEKINATLVSVQWSSALRDAGAQHVAAVIQLVDGNDPAFQKSEPWWAISGWQKLGLIRMCQLTDIGVADAVSSDGVVLPEGIERLKASEIQAKHSLAPWDRYLAFRGTSWSGVLEKMRVKWAEFARIEATLGNSQG